MLHVKVKIRTLTDNGCKYKHSNKVANDSKNVSGRKENNSVSGLDYMRERAKARQ